MRGAIEEALRCKREGKAETILFNLSGHGHFDMGSYATSGHGHFDMGTYATDGVTDEISQYVLSEFTVERFLAFWVSPQQVFSSPTTTGASLALRSSGLVRRAHRAQGQQSSCKHSMSKSTLSVKVSEGRFFKPRRLRHAIGQLPRCG